MQALFSKIFFFYKNNIARIIYYTCSITLVTVFIERVLIIFSYEAHTAGIDNNFDYPIIRSLAGYSMYPNPEVYPYAVNPYAPLFFIVCKSMAELLNVNPSDTITVYWVSRSVCLLADIGTGLIFFKILKKYAKINTATSIIYTTLFFCIISFLGYSINRSDSFFLFTYCCILYTLLHRKSDRAFWIAFLAVLVTVCIFSKQNGVTLLLLVPTWFIIEKKYKACIQFLLFFSFLFTGTFLYFQYIFTDQFFSRHIIEALNNKIDPQWFYIYVFKLIAPSYLTLPLAIALIISAKTITENKHLLLKKLSVIFILQLLLSTALSFKWGSSLGYYNESFLIGFVLIALFMETIEPSTVKKLISAAAKYCYPALLIFIIHMLAQLFFFFINSRDEAKTRYTEQQQISEYIKKGIGETNSYVIDMSNADFNFFKNMLFKECAAPNIDAVNCCTLPDNIFDYSGLLDGLKTGKILFIIKERDAIPGSFWNVDLHHYQKDATFNNYIIYKYKVMSAHTP